MTHEDTVDAVHLQFQEDFFDRWKKMGYHFKDESACLTVSARDELLCLSTNVQSFLGKRSTLFCSLVAKALDVRSTSNMCLSIGRMETRTLRKPSGSKSTKKRSEGPPRGNDNIDVYLLYADPL